MSIEQHVYFVFECNFKVLPSVSPILVPGNLWRWKFSFSTASFNVVIGFSTFSYSTFTSFAIFSAFLGESDKANLTSYEFCEQGIKFF